MNTEPEFRMQGRVRYGGRVVIPLVREYSVVHDSGSMGMVNPVALLFEDEGVWFFVPLECGIDESILEDIGVPATFPETGIAFS